jgi:hypothetical protein
LIEFLYLHPEENRFTKLIELFDEIFHAYKSGYDLYIEKFSYEELKSEFEQYNLEYLKRIGDALADVRNQVVVISTVSIAISQIDFKEPLNPKTILILSGVFLASLMYSVILYNQINIIKDIDNEIIDKESKIKTKQPDLYKDKFEKKFTGLKNRSKSQRAKIWLFIIILWIITVSLFILVFRFLPGHKVSIIAKNIYLQAILQSFNLTHPPHPRISDRPSLHRPR